MSSSFPPFRSLSIIAGLAAMLGCGSVLPAHAGQLVAFDSDEAAGTIIVQTGERRLYLTLGGGQALRYTVGVGRVDRQWAGRAAIEGKFVRPNWAPPPEVRRDRPGLPETIPGGAPNNPMGAAALTLSGGRYAIHGTNKPSSIGGFVSYGCIRMTNNDIQDFYARVRIGAPVLVR